jgi:cytochrome c-type biogenesis protein CcmH/NrfG
MPSLCPDVVALAGRVEDAIHAGLPSERLRPMVERLIHRAPVGSAPWQLAKRELARCVMDHDPWAAALVAREAVRQHSDDAAAWGLLALAQSLLGHHRYAIRAYRVALRLAPGDPWTMHNLGHLIDVALDDAPAAVKLLRQAYLLLPGNDEVAASYAHALARAGDPAHARTIMRRLVARGPHAAHHELYRWILEREDRQVAGHEQLTAPSRRRRPRKRRHTLGA